MNRRTKAILTAALAVSVFAPGAVARPKIDAVLNGASYKPFVAPGSIVAIFGSEFSNSTASAWSVPLPTALEGVSVTVDEVPAPLYFVSPSQINVQIPYETTAKKARLVVHTAGQEQASYFVPMLSTAPGVFTLSSDGQGAPVMLSPDFELMQNAAPGQRVILYATGLGRTAPAATTGDGGLAAEPFNLPIQPPEVFIWGQPAMVEFVGLAPGFPGVYQLNVIVPGNPVDSQLFVASRGRVSNVTSVDARVPDPLTGSGVIVSETREIVNFHTVQLHTIGDVDVQVGANPSLRIEADDDVIPWITTNVAGGKLRLGTNRPLQLRGRSIRFHITVPSLEAVELHGVGAIQVTGVNGRTFSASASGAGAIQASGTVDSLDAFFTGVTSAKFLDLSARHATVWLSGVGTVRVNAADSLTARAFGVCNIFYSGSPTEIDAEATGLASIRPI